MLKKHHLFLLIVALLLVAALAFPKPATMEQPTISISSADDLSDIPYALPEEDTLLIKKNMDPLSIVEKKEVTKLELFKNVTGQAPAPLHLKEKIATAKLRNDDIREDYYQIPPLPVGSYILRLHITRDNAGIPEHQIWDHKFDVVSKNDAVTSAQIKEGENY